MTGSIWGTHFTDLVQIRLKEHEYVVCVSTLIVYWTSIVGDFGIIWPNKADITEILFQVAFLSITITLTLAYTSIHNNK
jgi:hypothetical protein